MSSPSLADDPFRERSRYVGALMRVGWQWVRDQIYSGVVAAGYDDLNPAHVALIRYPTLDGLRPSMLAEQVGITKQSVNDLLGHLERHGYLVRVPDPADGRARAIRLTAKGQRLEHTINAQAQAAEMRIAEILGQRRLAQLRSSLELLAGATNDDEV
jgi:DNA-binding MarR family transcriptional regulator